MLENQHGTIWIRPNDLDRLFSAPCICYLVGGYDGSGNYGDILQLHAHIERLHAAGDNILAAPMALWKNIGDHTVLAEKHPWIFNESCFLYYVPADDLDVARPMLDDQHLVIVPSPPQAFSQVVVYGGGFFTSRWGWGAHKLNLIELVTTWLAGVPPGFHPLAIVGQQISSAFLEGSRADRFTTIVDQASIVGLRDEISLELLKHWKGSSSGSRATITGDDAVYPIVAARDRHPERDGSGPDEASQNGHPPVVNIHMNTEDYVTDRPQRLQMAFQAMVRDLHRVAGDGLVLNFLIAFEDSRISEARVVKKLSALPETKNCTVNVVSCLDELQRGFPNIGRAQLTIACSYHVALTSLLLGIPTAFAFSNEYYTHKAEGLKRAFLLPQEMLLDIQGKPPDAFSATLERTLRDKQYRATLEASASWGAMRMLLRSARTSTALTSSLTAKYVANREDRYQAAATRLVETTEQLSDLRQEYTRLLNTAARLSEMSSAKRAPDQPAVADYEGTLRSIQSVVDKQLAANAKVLVVSRGDEEMVNLAGRDGWHFPQTRSGVYAGHHPADSAAAVKHLTSLRDRGAEYLLLPNTGFWWLDYYTEFAQHLNQHHRQIWSDEHCIIYQLAGATEQPGASRKMKPATPTKPATGRSRFAPSEIEQNPIIVLGAPRSGTSYLTEILNQHPQVFISLETRVFVWAHRTLKIETQNDLSLFAQRDPFRQHLRKTYPSLVRNFYREVKPGVRYWGDKNPHYTSPDNDGCLQTILELFPGARFIHIIRDGRGTTTSELLKRWGDFEKVHRRWLSYVDVACKFGASLPSDQYFELRYEDLIRDDVTMARRLFDFLKIEIHPKVVSFCDGQRQSRTQINADNDARPMRDLNGDLTQSEWATVLTPEQQLRSLDLLGEHLNRFGYESEDSLAQIREDVLQSSRQSLVRSVGGAVLGILHARVSSLNGTGARRVRARPTSAPKTVRRRSVDGPGTSNG